MAFSPPCGAGLVFQLALPIFFGSRACQGPPVDGDLTSFVILSRACSNDSSSLKYVSKLVVSFWGFVFYSQILAQLSHGTGSNVCATFATNAAAEEQVGVQRTPQAICFLTFVPKLA